MKKTDWIRLTIAIAVALAFVKTGAARLPIGSMLVRHSPVVVYGEPMLKPLIVTAEKTVAKGVYRARGVLERAAAGVPVKVSLTQYCLKGETRRGRGTPRAQRQVPLATGPSAGDASSTAPGAAAPAPP